MYLEMSSAPSPDSPHSLSPDTDLLFSGYCCDNDTYFYLHLRSHKTKQADFVTRIPVAATKLRVAKSSYKIVANSQKGELASPNVLFYDFVFTLSGRMLWVSKHPLAIQRDEERPGGNHAAAGFLKREVNLSWLVWVQQDRGIFCLLMYQRFNNGEVTKLLKLICTLRAWEKRVWIDVGYRLEEAVGTTNRTKVKMELDCVEGITGHRGCTHRELDMTT